MQLVLMMYKVVLGDESWVMSRNIHKLSCVHCMYEVCKPPKRTMLNFSTSGAPIRVLKLSTFSINMAYIPL